MISVPPVTRRMVFLLLTGLLLLIVPWGGRVGGPTGAAAQSTIELIDSALSIHRYIDVNLEKLVTPEYVAWRNNLRRFQQEEYASILFQVRRGDGMGSFVTYLRMALQLELTLNHEQITFRNAQQQEVALPQDWTFPRDPWAERKRK